MVRLGRLSAVGLALAAALLGVTDPARDYSGTWIGDSGQVLTITQDSVIHCSLAANGGAPATWSYNLDGAESRYRMGAEVRSSIVKWEGAALLVNTLVSGPRDYTEMDRWRLSRDRNVLTINRQTVTARGNSEAVLVYRREGTAAPEPAPLTAPVTANVPPESRAPAAEPRQLRREPPPEPADLVVRAGSHIPLALRNSVDTKHSHDGDHIYLETIQPISAEGRIVIPRGSYVNGTVTSAKAAGVLKSKGELYIRFDSLVLPNGTMRDFHARLASADGSARGTVDPKEGKVTGERDTASEARGAAEGGAIGAGVGGVAGAAAGHPITGLGVGAGAGAAAGLATVMVRHRPDAALPRGTVVDMVLDRDLHFTPAELRF